MIYLCHYFQYEKERVLAEKMEKKRKASTNDTTEDLFKAIQSRQTSRIAQQNDFLQKLEQKYATPSPKSRPKRRKA